MTQLLLIRAKIKAFYAKYEIFLTPAMKFVLALATLLTINSNVGFNSRLKSLPVVLILSVICSVLPYSGIVFVIMAALLMHLFSLSMEVAVAFAMVFLVMCLLYYIFLPGDSIVLILTPLLFFWRLPLVIPIVLGLAGSVLSAVPMSFGVFTYYMLKYVKDNGSSLADTSSLGMLQRYTQIFTSLMENRALFLILAAFAVTCVAVRIIRWLSVNRAWEVAIGSGILLNALFLLAGTFSFNMEAMGFSIASILVGSAIAAVAAFGLQFFLFSVDYSRTEYTQFEDDEYYYYVKAVPKVNITEPDVQIKKINSVRQRRTVKK